MEGKDRKDVEGDGSNRRTNGDGTAQKSVGITAVKREVKQKKV